MADRRLRLERTLGPGVVQWMERELVHGPGDIQGQPLRLDDEQVAFVLRAYEIDDRGKRVVRRAVFSRAKGRAKSELGAAITCAEALGPVRFRGWGEDGRPVGGPIVSPFIRCAATEEGQADNVYSPVEYMLREGPISRTPGLDVGITRTFLPGGGKIMPITGKSSSKDGGKETFAVFDETHLMVLEDLKRMHATIRRNLAKRRAAQPWSLELTTMYAPGEDSVAESSHDYAEKIAAGKITDPSFLFDHRAGPVELDWDDDEELRAGLVQAYGSAAEWMDIERLIAEIRDPDTSEQDARRFFFNVPTVGVNSWMKTGVWDACACPGRVVAPKTWITLGFDGSYNQDSTGLVGCTVEEVPHLFVIGVWERPPKAREWIVPRDAVKMSVHHTMETFEVGEMPADPPGWHSEIEEWAQRYGSPPIVAYEHNKTSIMAPACREFYSDVVHRRVSHDGNPVLARHIANARLKDTPDGAYIVKENRWSLKKIDLAVAAVAARDRAKYLYAHGGASFDALSDEEFEAAVS